MLETFLLDTTIYERPGLFANDFAQMPESRRDKIVSYRFEKDRRLSLGAGVLWRYGLNARGIAESDPLLRFGANGKPYLSDHPDIFFNISHSGNFVICSFSEHEVGIDIEQVTGVDNDLLRQVCVPSEYKYLTSLDENSLKHEFFRLWTIKESYMKYRACGLSLPPDDLEITFDDPVTLRCQGTLTQVVFKEYKLDGYKITVCTEPGTVFAEHYFSPFGHSCK